MENPCQILDILSVLFSYYPIQYVALSGQTGTDMDTEVLFIKLRNIIRHSVITSALSLFHAEINTVLSE